jgi:HEAT repeat protein
MDFFLSTIVSYLVSLAAGFHTNGVSKSQLGKAQEILQRTQNLKDAKLFTGVDAVYAELMAMSEHVLNDTMQALQVHAQTTPLLVLFKDPAFLRGLAQWLVMWNIEEGLQAKTDLEERMVVVLRSSGAAPGLIMEFRQTFFALADRDIFRHEALAHWRHQLSLNALHQKVDELRQLANELAKKFTPEQLQQALNRYRDLALKSCDILDLAGLPEDDRHLATQKFVLRSFYVPLRVNVESQTILSSEELEQLESRREYQRLVAAGRVTERKEKEKLDRVSIGERLQQTRRFVVLGDPGAGKTTLVRWLVTAYLLKMKQDPDFAKLPDVVTLPEPEWLPVLIRCRELDEQGLNGGLDDILRQTLRKAEMTDEAEALLVVLKQHLVTGTALLLVDGLDEITDPTLRVRFCRQLESIAVAYPEAPMITTSRIVGYREMSFRIGREFEHVTVADLSKEDKDEFAQRWCLATEPEERCERSTQELIQAIHSSDRIERLTGNPMLLTTLALVKRKVGKLPSRRADLYREAVEVLLNWRSEVEKPLDRREALPQLEYVAYEMCRRGEQRLREDEILALLQKVRADYPNIRPVQQHSAEEFLKILERRTGILVEVGTEKHEGWPVPVYEFRHLTFQEYLAGLALVTGHFPGHDKTRSLAQRIAPLAGLAKEKGEWSWEKEFVASENWREALRLCIASCNDGDVDDALVAILTPLEGEAADQIARPRAVLAVLCLADEPNVSDAVGEQVLTVLAQQVKNGGTASLDAATMELAHSEWSQHLQVTLAKEFCQHGAKSRWNPGGLYAMIVGEVLFSSSDVSKQLLAMLVDHLNSSDEINSIITNRVFFSNKFPNPFVSLALEKLVTQLDNTPATAHTATWAMCWLAKKNNEEVVKWVNNEANIQIILDYLSKPNFDVAATRGLIEFAGKIKDCRAVEPLIAKLEDVDNEVKATAYRALGEIRDRRAVEPLMAKLEKVDNWVRRAACDALGEIKDPHTVEPLMTKLEGEDADVRKQVLGVLAKITGDEIDQKLLSRDIDTQHPWLDPKEPISQSRITKAVKELKLPREEIQQRYENLAKRFGLKLEWTSTAD